MISMGTRVQMSRGMRGVIFALVSSAMAASTAASGQSLTTLTNLSYGEFPWGSLVVDAQGNLFGTTGAGGAYGDGTVFEIVKTSSGYASTPTTLVEFDDANGAFPEAALIVDANGNLFGTTSSGGAYGNGTVFEIAKTSSGYASTPTTLVSFDDIHGSFPLAGLIADANGNLFGTTNAGGLYGDGTVFEIVKTSSGYATTPTILVNFDNTNGAFPLAGLVADANGNLFGTTVAGGVYGDGTVFEIARSSSGYAGTPTTLANFDYTSGAFPEAALIVDANGNLFGTTEAGGAYGFGTVFEIANTRGVYAGTPTTLVDFDSSRGAFPVASLIIDGNSNLFGTTKYGGAYGAGSVFEIANSGGVYGGTPITLVSFNGADGSHPAAGLISDGSGNLFGTTVDGGSTNTGTVFEITSSGFVPPNLPPNVPPQPSSAFAGTPGNPNCIGKSISALAHTYGGIAHAAPALGYGSVSVLQSAVAEYCSK
jgi:uncharacterized repeat protein (TIGR03803 family)